MEKITLTEQIGFLLEYNSKESHLYSLGLFREYYENLFNEMHAEGKLSTFQYEELIERMFDVQIQVLETTFKRYKDDKKTSI